MAWFGKKNKQAKRIRGTAQVVSTTRAPHAATYGNLTMDLVVQAPGIEPYAHDYSKLIVPVAKWPSPGMTLPVDIDPTDPTDVDVPWDELPWNAERADQQAEQLAAMMRGEGSSGGVAQPGPPDAGGLTDVLAQIGELFPGAQVAIGGDPGSSSQMPPPVTGTAGITVVASQSDGDPVERLTKLAKLREAGIIDDAQFEQLRQQILGQAGIE